MGQATASKKNLLRFNTKSSFWHLPDSISDKKSIILTGQNYWHYLTFEYLYTVYNWVFIYSTVVPSLSFPCLCTYLFYSLILIPFIYFFCLCQVLKGRDQGIMTFGYSLAGNMDLDNNQYPDLAIGSLSNTVVVYRSELGLFSHNKNLEKISWNIGLHLNDHFKSIASLH